LTKNEAGPDFAAQLNKLGVGQISKPFRTKDGLGLVKVLSIQPEKVKPYKSVRTKVKQAYERQQLAQLFSEISDKLIDFTYTNPDSLEPAAKELGLKVKTTGLITSVGGKSGITANNKIIKAAFSNDVLEQKYNSNPIEVEAGKLVVLRVGDHIPQSLESLDKVRTGIAAKLKAKETRKKAYELSQQLLLDLKNGKSVSKIVKQHNFVLNTMVNIGRYQYSKKTIQLVDAAFDLNKPTPNKLSAAVVDLHNDYAVLRLTKVYESNSPNETKKEKSFLKTLSRRLGKYNYQLLVDNLMNKAKIKVHEEV
jgi:peptidyl-prolyl cis-trans isomerase D